MNLSQVDSGTRVSVRNLWKIFGENVTTDLQQQIQGLSKAEAQSAHNIVVALQDVNFDVSDGETFVVMGLSGSGKSTLVRCINRLIEPTSGTVSIDGEDVLGYSEHELTEFRRKKTAMVFQQFGLLPHRTVLENAAFGLEIQDDPRGAAGKGKGSAGHGGPQGVGALQALGALRRHAAAGWPGPRDDL